MKKVLVIDGSAGMIAGAQKVTLNIVNILSNNGTNVELLIRSKNSMVKSEYSAFNHTFLWGEWLLSKVLSIGATANNNGIIKKAISSFIMLFAIIVTNIQVCFYIITNKPSHIYTIDPRGIILCGLACRLFRVKLIWHLHGELRVSNIVKKIFCFLASSIVVPSRAILNSLNSNEKVTVLYNGFRFEDITVQDKVKNKKTLIKLIFVGSIVPHKGLHKIIYAIQKLGQSSHFHLTVVGASVGDVGLEYKQYLDDYLVKEGISGQIDFIGWSSNIPSLLVESDLLIFPSVQSEFFVLNDKKLLIESSEALPTVLIEAKAYGVPVIASNVAGVDEIINNNIDGYVVDNLSVDDIVNYLHDFDKYISILEPNSSEARVVFSLESMKDNLNIIFK
jgi:glycosyltransferase involved in cell wall biosynthesis